MVKSDGPLCFKAPIQVWVAIRAFNGISSKFVINCQIGRFKVMKVCFCCFHHLSRVIVFLDWILIYEKNIDFVKN